MPQPTVEIRIVAVGHERIKREIAELQAAARNIRAPMADNAQLTGIQRAQRGLEQLRTSLGGVERAQVQFAQSTRQLDAAVRAGLVSQRDELGLRGLISRQLSEQTTRARQLTGSMAALRREAAMVAASQIPGASVLPLSALRGRVGVGLGVGAGLVGAGLAGERAALQRQQLAALGAPGVRPDVLELGLRIGDVETAISTFKRLAIARDELGVDTARLVEFERRLFDLMRLSGGASQEAAAGVFQLSQALASGRLQGDEFRSIMENLPLVAKAISRGLVEMGVATRGSIGELRALSTAGELTSQRVFEAFIRGSEDMARAADDMTRPVTTSLRTIGASTLELIGAFGELSGMTPTIQLFWTTIATGAEQAAAAVARYVEEHRNLPPPTMAPGSIRAGQRLREMLLPGERPDIFPMPPYPRVLPPPFRPDFPVPQPVPRGMRAAFARRGDTGIVEPTPGRAGGATARDLPMPAATSARAERAAHFGELAAARGIIPPEMTAAAARQEHSLERQNELLRTQEQLLGGIAEEMSSIASTAVFEGLDQGAQQLLRTLVELGIQAAVIGALFGGAKAAGFGPGAGAGLRGAGGLLGTIAQLAIPAAMGASTGGGSAAVMGAAGAHGAVGGMTMQLRQHGGPVDPSHVYMVGERGPEMFVPRTAGKIVPEAAGGGGPTTVVQNRFDMSGSVLTPGVVAAIHNVVAEMGPYISGMVATDFGARQGLRRAAGIRR
jgi:tape measure domain-containing protein